MNEETQENQGTQEPQSEETEPVFVPDPLLALTKLKLRISADNTDFDDELNDDIAAAKQDLGIAGVVLPDSLDAVCRTAIITYVKMHFGQPDNYDQLKKSYDEQKQQLSTCTGYTDWLVGVDDGQI